MIAAAARDPTPATVYVRTTSSGVSTSTVGASEVVRGTDTGVGAVSRERAGDAAADGRERATQATALARNGSMRELSRVSECLVSAFTCMRVVLQRVSRAEVRVREPSGRARVTGRIDRGFLLLVGF